MLGVERPAEKMLSGVLNLNLHTCIVSSQSLNNVSNTLGSLHLGSSGSEEESGKPEMKNTTMEMKKTHRRKRAGGRMRKRRMLQHWRAWLCNNCTDDSENAMPHNACHSQQMLKSPERLGNEECQSEGEVISPVEALQLNLLNEKQDAATEDPSIAERLGLNDLKECETKRTSPKRSRRRRKHEAYVVLRPRTIAAPKHPSQEEKSDSEQSGGESPNSTCSQDYYYEYELMDLESCAEFNNSENNLWDKWPVENDNSIPQQWSGEEDNTPVQAEQLKKLPNSKLIERINAMSSLLFDRISEDQEEEGTNISSYLEELERLKEENSLLKEENQELQQNIVNVKC